MTTTSLDSDTKSSEAIVNWNIESGPDSASEAEDGESLEGIEYEDRSVDGSDFAASLKDFFDDADSGDCGQSTMFYAAFDNAREAQIDSAELLEGQRNCRSGRRKRTRNDDKGGNSTEFVQRKTCWKVEGTLRKAADSDAEPSTFLPNEMAVAPTSPPNHEKPTSSLPNSEQLIRPPSSSSSSDVDSGFEELREYFKVCRIDPDLERTYTELQQGPSPALEAPVPRIDPILAAAHHFHSLGVVTVTHDLQETRFSKGQVRKKPCNWGSESKPWKEADLTNCLSEFAKPGRNSIAILTEKSDIYALDVDVKDGGYEALELMLEEHGGFQEDTPRLTTGNGGFHILFL
ncbi:hypothetical protein KFL_003660010, partial [Klebsormidium nitens]